MTATITIPCAVPAPTVEQVRAWLTREGWENASAISPWEEWWLGSLRLLVPLRSDWLMWPAHMARCICDVAEKTGQSEESVYRAIMGPL